MTLSVEKVNRFSFLWDIKLHDQIYNNIQSVINEIERPYNWYIETDMPLFLPFFLQDHI